MGDVAAILGLAPAAAPDDAVFLMRGGASGGGRGAGASSTAAPLGGKKPKLSRELSALVGDNVEELMPPVVRFA